jgi:leader peptidase (prepilin peptidase) / N-methyltransferase
MNVILSIPMDARVVAVFFLGACIGGAVNWATYALAWNPRPISPWSRDAPGAARRRWSDRVPILGWLGLTRESRLHGIGFWIRPMLVEIIIAVGLAGLYAWEVGAGGLLAAPMPRPWPMDLETAVHLQFAGHAVLIALMMAASLIDIDEKIIPDAITIPGTLIGFLLAVVVPWSRLPAIDANGLLTPLHLSSPNPAPPQLAGCPQGPSLVLALACWLAWAAALLPRTWYSRHGWIRAARLSLARVARERATYRILRMAVMGVLAITIVWIRGRSEWDGLLSALVGMAVGGAMVWAVRIIGTAALRREAMGFGDVTLMAMIGAFLGWQTCVAVFFLAPFAGLLVGVLRLLLFRDREIPYGPFLCLAALFVVVRWAAVWDRTQDVFALGWVVPLAMFCCLPLMAAMLLTWRLILGAIRLLLGSNR